MALIATAGVAARGWVALLYPTVRAQSTSECTPFLRSHRVCAHAPRLSSRRLPLSMSASSAARQPTPAPGYRPCVGCCLLSHSNQVFVARRADQPLFHLSEKSVCEARKVHMSCGLVSGQKLQQPPNMLLGSKVLPSGAGAERSAWQMPQGGVDVGEDVEVAVMRELLEETGITSAEILHEVPGWLHYDFPPELLEKWQAAGLGWGGRYKGQAQKWFLLRFVGDEDEVDLSGIGEAREFAQWKWLPVSELPNWVVPFKKEVYSEVTAACVEYIDGNNLGAGSKAS